MKVIINRNVVNVIGLLFLITLVGMLSFDLLRRGIYSNKLGINVAVVGDNSVALMLLRPEEELISWVTVPNNLKIKIFNSSANYPVISLWQYGIAEKNPFEIFERSLGISLGVAVPRTIKVNGDATIEAVLGSLHKIGLKTDISLRDKIQIRKFVADMVESKKVIEEIVPKNVFDEIIEPDGKIFLHVNSIAELWTNSKFILEPILSENADVTVNNLTGQPGYGFEVAKQIESSGMRVIEVKADGKDSVSGNGCLFRIPSNVPVSEEFLINHLSCQKILLTKEGSQKGIEVWLK